eukprot:252481_1
MVEYLLYEITEKNKSNEFTLFEPFNIKLRKQYLKPQTDANTKHQIGENILNIQIPNDYSQYPILTDALQQITCSDFFIKQHSFLYDYYDAFSLLYNYHQIWCQHIQSMTPSLSILDDKKESRQNYVDWDQPEINQTMPRMPGMKLRINLLKSDPTSKLKANNVSIKSIWSYACHFIGPCYKSIQKNTDWRCMQCNGLSNYEIFGNRIRIHIVDKIVFWKCRRTDVTIEICRNCVRRGSFRRAAKSRYNKMDNGRTSTFPKNIINQRNSYMIIVYNNNASSYQTYNVINKPPDQDNIFVRQHHHSGGRKYHYKLRINK